MTHDNANATSAKADQIFDDLYRSFFAMPHVTWEAKHRAFETMVENLPHPLFVFWEIVGITPAALDQIVESGTTKGIQRAHDMSRRERGAAMFDRETPMPDAYEFFYQHDKTILTTKGENDRDDFDRAAAIPLCNSYFGRHTYAVPSTRKVVAYLTQVRAAIKAEAA